ncbi:GIY-YIG nuclease family protein [Pseudomonas fluorescens]|uniref:GIY-YIG nuclease family protein n=1 Tax=Pseudomonas fluorescens TaxID=294 RepID=UPI0027364480|nr:GIY-YIG nuclease family protein [Pseudomonas fluorescens]WLH72525.1 GIY-YIG nuclease family protein [Pseudomonas fluorescens]
MVPGYIYILQNPLYGAYVVKIGLTRREPNARARELYEGSSGVPMPFEIATAFSVGDCKLAEKRIHRRFAAYRINGRREFFRISPAVAAAVTLETCTKLNNELGLPPSSPYEINKVLGDSLADKPIDEAVSDFEQIGRMRLMKVSSMHDSPLGTSILTTDQLDRVEILKMLFSRLYPGEIEEILSGFSRDRTPEREIRIWEHIAKAYLTIEQVDFTSDGLRKEAFNLLLMRSWSSTEDVLSRIKLNHFTLKSAKKLLQAYELRPKPITVRQTP